MKKLPLHWKIVIGMVAGILFGLPVSAFGEGKQFVNDWIAPFGTIFIKLLKMIAIPLIFTSLVKGISDLKDISKFRNIGVRTIIILLLSAKSLLVWKKSGLISNARSQPFFG